jgi:hypothetical protein
MIRTYRHYDDKGTFLCWMTETPADKFSSSSRLATPEEIAAIEAVERREKDVAAMAVADQAELEELRAFKTKAEAEAAAKKAK